MKKNLKTTTDSQPTKPYISYPNHSNHCNSDIYTYIIIFISYGVLGFWGLDTVVLLGAISAQYAPNQLQFGGGAVLGSLFFFSALGFGARLLAPIFASARSWVVLEVVVGVTMWTIAVALILKG